MRHASAWTGILVVLMAASQPAIGVADTATPPPVPCPEGHRLLQMGDAAASASDTVREIDWYQQASEALDLCRNALGPGTRRAESAIELDSARAHFGLALAFSEGTDPAKTRIQLSDAEGMLVLICIGPDTHDNVSSARALLHLMRGLEPLVPGFVGPNFEADGAGGSCSGITG